MGQENWGFLAFGEVRSQDRNLRDRTEGHRLYYMHLRVLEGDRVGSIKGAFIRAIRDSEASIDLSYCHTHSSDKSQR